MVYKSNDLPQTKPLDLPLSNSMADISYNLIIPDEFSEVACLENETWGLISSNRTIAQVSMDTGEYLKLFSDYGMGLTGLAVNEEYIYVSNCQYGINNTILVLDKNTGLKVDEFDIGTDDFSIWGLEYDNGSLWVDETHNGEYYLLKVNANTGAVISNFTSPYALVAGPRFENTVYCMDYSHNKLIAFDATTGQLIMKANYSVGITGDWGISKQGDYLVLSNFNAANLYFVRAKYSTGETVFWYDLASTYPFAFRIANNGTHYFIRPSYTTSVKVFEIGTGVEVDTLSLSFIPFGITYANDYLWISEVSSPGKIHKIALDGTEVSSFTPDPGGNSFISGLATDGTYLWASFINGTIAKIDISSQTIVEHFKLNGIVSEIVYNDELNELWGIAENDHNLIYRINLETQQIDRAKSIATNTEENFGITLWRDKILTLSYDVDFKPHIYFLQNNLQAEDALTYDANADDTSGTDDTSAPELFGFNAYYVVGAGAGAGLILGLILGGLLFSKKKKT